MKPLPDPSERDLIPPDMDYVYFEGCEQHPLEPDQASYSPANAWWLAESSFLVYCHPGFARMACRLAGLDQFHFFEATGTECMLCWNREVAIVAFRGTELKSMSSLHEIRTDLNATPVPFDGGGPFGNVSNINILYRIIRARNHNITSSGQSYRPIDKSVRFISRPHHISRSNNDGPLCSKSFDRLNF